MKLRISYKSLVEQRSKKVIQRVRKGIMSNIVKQRSHTHMLKKTAYFLIPKAKNVKKLTHVLPKHRLIKKRLKHLCSKMHNTKTVIKSSVLSSWINQVSKTKLHNITKTLNKRTAVNQPDLTLGKSNPAKNRIPNLLDKPQHSSCTESEKRKDKRLATDS